MHRRRFLHTFLAAPALTPLLLAADKIHPRGELHLISDEPEAYLPLLLAESADIPSRSRKTFAFLSPHPRRSRLFSTLTDQGWEPETDPSRAQLTLTFVPMMRPSRPSFALVRNGRIRDIRSRKLRALWDRMGRESEASASLTVAGLRPVPHRGNRGKFAAIYHEGILVERIRLDRDGSKRLQMRTGALVVRVESGRVRVAESPCWHQICLGTPPIDQTGQRIICAPNHLLVEVQGAPGLDTVIG